MGLATLVEETAREPATPPGLIMMSGSVLTAGSVVPASLLPAEVLPVEGPLAGLLPRGVRRGSVVEITGSTTLALLMLAAVLPGQDWAAVVGLPSLGVAAAVEAGVDLGRLALVPDPGNQWSRVVAALFDGFTAVVVGQPRQASQAPLTRGDANRLVARARERGSVLLATGGWPLQPDQRLAVVGQEWQGLGRGEGRLRSRRLEVVATGRGSAARERRLSLLLSPVHGITADEITADEVKGDQNASRRAVGR